MKSKTLDLEDSTPLAVTNKTQILDQSPSIQKWSARAGRYDNDIQQEGDIQNDDD